MITIWFHVSMSVENATFTDLETQNHRANNKQVLTEHNHETVLSVNFMIRVLAF